LIQKKEKKKLDLYHNSALRKIKNEYYCTTMPIFEQNQQCLHQQASPRLPLASRLHGDPQEDEGREETLLRMTAATTLGTSRRTPNNDCSCLSLLQIIDHALAIVSNIEDLRLEEDSAGYKNGVEQQ
jgi:hypothetical protein